MYYVRIFFKYELGKGQPFIHSFIQGTRNSFPKSGMRWVWLCCPGSAAHGCGSATDQHRAVCHLLHFSSGLLHPSSANLVSPSQEGTIRGQLSVDSWSAPGTAAQGSWAHATLPPRLPTCWDHRLISPVFFFFFVILTLLLLLKIKGI